MEYQEVNKLADDSARVLAMFALNVGPYCRKCGSPLSAKSAASFRAGKRVKCPRAPECDWYGRWRDNTRLHRSTLTDRQFLALWYHYSMPLSQADIAKFLGISPTTVREWRKTIQAIVIDEDAAA